ncbi:adenine deaminase [Candidatus Formimonas warabiya]|uniref:Adenine deaminase n=1 Tax=Formimonas warabiya TaxID=1761012 RepID=A0A3G1KQX6_FORW1|nr:adenine deaminase [Candidatus Formimonas warabiya]ATW24861.1 adenine deaminase [Candidatus Formimonas warabiya]
MVYYDQSILAMARGHQAADLVLKNGMIVDVFSGTCFSGDVAISGGYIVGTGSYQGKEEVDLGGSFVVPGFIDAHVHIESSLVSPVQYSATVMPKGTTTIIADPHELANVYGTRAIDYLLQESERIPLDIYLMLPSCVPATHLETSGAALTADDLAKFIGHPRVLGLAEMMNYPGVIFGDRSVWAKLDLFQEKKMRIDGHITGVNAQDLSAYVLGGITSNHECTSSEEALQCLRAGLKLMIREGTAAKNLKDLLPAVNKYNSSRCMLCTDDRHPTDLIKEGHINHLVKLCIAQGMEPVTAIQMATINPAQHFGLKQLGAVAPGYQADLVILNDLDTMAAAKVFKKGKLAAVDGKAVYQVPEEKVGGCLPEGLKIGPISPGKLTFNLKDDVHVIKIIPHQLVTEKITVPSAQYLSGAGDIVKLVVVERHHGSGNIGVGLVHGFHIKNGAIASTVAHDSHNLIIAGDNDDDILRAIDEMVRLKGGLAVVKEGKVLASLALPLGGLMSYEPVEKVVETLELVKAATRELGVSDDFDPFMTLAFLSLPVIPQIRLTDLGLVDVNEFKIIPL